VGEGVGDGDKVAVDVVVGKSDVKVGVTEGSGVNVKVATWVPVGVRVLPGKDRVEVGVTVSVGNSVYVGVLVGVSVGVMIALEPVAAIETLSKQRPEK
jgi:hypothetical protein